jgi:hypothetical protein
MIALGLNTENIKPSALRSIIGPNTKNASREPPVNVEAKARAKNESTVEQIDTTAPNNIIAIIDVTGP